MAFGEHGLGKSLSDVFARTPKRDGGRGYLDLDITSIVPPAENPRKVFEPTALEELAASIRIHGLLQPIVVLKREGAYEILSGERRYRAAKLAGLTRIPAVVREDDNPQHVAELRLIENIQRENLNPVELAQALHDLLHRHGLTHEELAERVGKDRSSITNSLRLLGLPAALLDEVAGGALSMGHAKALLGIQDPAWQLALARRAIEEHLSVREVERLAKTPPPAAEGAAATPAKAPHVRELETNLFHLFGTRVTVKDRNGKGSVTLHFDSRDHFQRVIAIMDRVIKQANQPTPDRPPGK